MKYEYGALYEGSMIINFTMYLFRNYRTWIFSTYL